MIIVNFIVLRQKCFFGGQPFCPGLNTSDQEAFQQAMVKKDEEAKKALRSH
jgi:hypothetical protein